jgi:Protein of unknown function (DUF1574)
MKTTKSQYRARRMIVSGIGGLLSLQAAFSLLLPWWHPDMEYRVRREALQARIAERPADSLFLMVGSSRVSFAFDPESLTPMSDDDGRQVLSFNFGHFNAGPTANLLTVDRLLRADVKPRWLLVEINPPLCAHDWSGFVQMGSWGDIQTINKYYSAKKFAGSVLRNHLLVPWFRHRGELQKRYLDESNGEQKEFTINRFGWWSGVPESTNSERRARDTGQQRDGFAADLSDQFQVAPVVDKAMRDLLSLCRTEGISVGFILMPEGESFRSWYSPAAEKKLQEFLSFLTADYQVPVFDTRDWFDDSFFVDSHHMLQNGAQAFTARFQEEILRPFINTRRVASGEFQGSKKCATNTTTAASKQ